MSTELYGSEVASERAFVVGSDLGVRSGFVSKPAYHDGSESCVNESSFMRSVAKS
jgi:hypothetical protein